MKYKYLNNNKIYEEKENKTLKFLYNKKIGRIVLKLIINKFFSDIVGWILSRRISSLYIKYYKKKNCINTNDCIQSKYKNFNEFFTRKRKEIQKNEDLDVFISNCDSKISIYKISEDLIINVKNTKYTIEELVKDKKITQKYKDGYCVIYRLSPSDYHRYIFIDNGEQEYIKKIKGKYHTVNPIIYDKYKVFFENTREINLLKTERFGNIIQIEVGALCVGRISNYKNIKEFTRYDEKGYFEFGGSTIIQLVESSKIKFEEEILNNTLNQIETKVNIGERIGIKFER